jgi:DnaJ-class molecular chaperone
MIINIINYIQYDLRKLNTIYKLYSTKQSILKTEILQNIFGGNNPFFIFKQHGGVPGGHGGHAGSIRTNMPFPFPFVQQNNLQKPTPIIKHVELDFFKVFSGCMIPVEIERWIIDPNYGKIFENETLYVNIYEGIDQGEIIILREKGNITPLFKGDVQIHVKIIPHPEFKRNGLDIIYQKKITLKEALCGLKIQIFHYIDGKNYQFTRNNISQTEIKIAKMGFKRENIRGNLIIQLQIEYPKFLTEEKIKILQEILP